MNGLKIPALIQKSREYAYLGIYDKAIDGFSSCVRELRVLTEHHKDDLDISFQFLELAEELSEELEACQRMKSDTTKKPENDENLENSGEKLADPQNNHNKEALFDKELNEMEDSLLKMSGPTSHNRQTISYLDNQNSRTPNRLSIIPEVQEPAMTHSSKPQRGSLEDEDYDSRFPFGKRPFEFHWEQRYQSHPPGDGDFFKPKLRQSSNNKKNTNGSMMPVANYSKPTESSKAAAGQTSGTAMLGNARARAMAYTGHLDKNPDLKLPGKQLAQIPNNAPRPAATEKDPMKWDPPSPKKETRKVKTSNGVVTLPNPSNGQSRGDQSLDSKSKDKARKDYEKPWRVERPPSTGGQRSRNPDQSEFLMHIYPSGDGPDANLIKSLEKEVVERQPSVSFDDIAALDEAKDVIRESVLLPLLMPEYFTGLRKPRKGVLLFGPPGTGKTLLAKAVASRGQTTFFNVHSSSLASKWRGESEKLVRYLFEMARFYAPTTIFIDEIDCIAGNRGDGEHESSRKVKAELLVQIDGAVETAPGEKAKLVVVLGATNLPWDLDPAVIRRLDKRIYIPLPDVNARRKLFQILLKDTKVEDDIDWELLVSKTELFSGDDLKNLCRDASMMPLRRELLRGTNLTALETSKPTLDVQEVQARLQNLPISMKDFLGALEGIRPTNSKDKLERYKNWMDEHGST